MKLYQIHFSPTGGTKKALWALSEPWNCEKIKINLLPPDEAIPDYQFTPEDVCIVAVPSFGGRVPKPALDRLRTLNGNGAKAVLLAAYGNRNFDDTLLELKNVLKEAGFFCAAAVAAVTEHSVIRCFGFGRPNSADRLELKKYGKQIIKHLENSDPEKEVTVPGNEPYREYHGIPIKPHPTRKCTNCQICATQCPTRAISETDPFDVDYSKCISCMRCVVICPSEARHNKKLMLLAAWFKMRKSCKKQKWNYLFL